MGEDTADSQAGRNHELGRRVLEVVVIYDDLEAASRAKQSLEALPAGAAPASTFSTRLWKVELLANGFLREQAAKEAAAADIILLAVAAVHDLPASVKKWLQRWSECRTARPCAFCLLMGPKARCAAEAATGRAALEHLVRQGGAEFFVGVCRTPADALIKASPLIPPAALDRLLKAPRLRHGTGGRSKSLRRAQLFADAESVRLPIPREPAAD